jgi:hypothetical protein
MAGGTVPASAWINGSDCRAIVSNSGYRRDGQIANDRGEGAVRGQGIHGHL